MRNLVLIVLVLFMPFWCGCIAFYGHEKYQFKVVDAEQNEPVEGATVSVFYLNKMILNSPKPSETMTDQNGLTELKLADLYPLLRVKAEGYIPVAATNFPSDSKKKSAIKHNFEIQNENEVVVSIYKEPKPTIEIVVPDGYRGPVALGFIPADKLTQGTPGQRFFSYKMSHEGYVEVPTWPLFYSCNIKARYENGDQIPKALRSRPERIAFIRVCDRGQKRMYLIGTFKEEDELKRKIWPEVDGVRRFGGPYDVNFDSYFPK